MEFRISDFRFQICLSTTITYISAGRVQGDYEWTAKSRDRTRQFALRIVKLAAALPKTRLGDVLGRQVLRSGTSIGANYCEALRASSRKHFISTLEIVLREADETSYWLELIGASEIVKPTRLDALKKECGELIAIFVATIRSTKER